MTLKAGSIVVITSSKSKNRGEYGFIYKVFDNSSRPYGLLLKKVIKIAYSKTGILEITDETTPAAADAVKERDAYFSGNKKGAQHHNKHKVNAEEEQQSKSTAEVNKASNTADPILTELALAIKDLHAQMLLFHDKTAHNFAYMNEMTRQINHRLDILETEQNSSQSGSVQPLSVSSMMCDSTKKDD